MAGDHLKKETYLDIEWVYTAISCARMASIGSMTLIVKQVDGKPSAPTWQPWVIGPQPGMVRCDSAGEYQAAHERAIAMAKELAGVDGSQAGQ